MAKILVIDDDPAVLRSLKAMLEKGGHQATVAENGLIGVRMLTIDRFAVVICDLLMPVQEGMETIQQIREVDARVPIIAISGAFVHPDGPLADARMMGADAALAKPFTMTELLDLVEDTLDRGHA